MGKINFGLRESVLSHKLYETQMTLLKLSVKKLIVT